MKRTAYDILSSYGLQYKERGDDYILLCPFHQDKNPSFSIDKKTGIYHCWSCGEKGNLVTFVQKFEGIEKDEAVKKVYGNDNLKITRVEKEDDEENLYKQEIERDKEGDGLEIEEIYQFLYYLLYPAKKILLIDSYTEFDIESLKKEEDFEFLFQRQKDLNEKNPGYNICKKRTLLDYVVKEILPVNPRKKYKTLIDNLNYYGFKKELQYIFKIIENKKYRYLKEKLRKEKQRWLNRSTKQRIEELIEIIKETLPDDKFLTLICENMLK